MSQANISMYAGLWSLLGIRLTYGRGVEDSKLRILGRGGRAGKAFAKADAADANFRMSALGDTMYVSRWCRGGIALARRQ